MVARVSKLDKKYKLFKPYPTFVGCNVNIFYIYFRYSLKVETLSPANIAV